MKRNRFEELVGEALDGLPKWVHERLENVEILIEDEPPEDENLLGLYEGVPLTERGLDYSWAMPDRITLFQGPIEDEAESDGDVRRVVAETVVHEIAHFFGISDDRLHELGRD